MYAGSRFQPVLVSKHKRKKIPTVSKLGVFASDSTTCLYWFWCLQIVRKAIVQLSCILCSECDVFFWNLHIQE